MKTTKNHKLNNLLILYLSIFLLSFTGPLAKLISWPAHIIILGRSFFAAISLYVFFLFKKTSLKLKSKKDIAIFIGLGILLALHWVFYFAAIKVSTVAIGMISLYTYPVISTLIEPFFFNEKFRLKELISAIFVFVGIIILAPEFSLSNHIFQGILLGLSSALLFSIRSIYSRKIIKSYSGPIIMFYQLIFATIFLCPLLFFYSFQITTNNIIYLLLLSIICTGLAHTLWVSSLAHFKVATTGVISCLAPVLGALLAIFFIGEIPSLRTIIGGIIILLIVIYETIQIN
jgi:drug/metabolite transporter (DMT)-like permease